MKLRTIFLVVFIIFISSKAIVAQKLIRSMASDICDCLNDIKDDYKSSEPKEVLGKCFSPVMAKYEKQIRKKYGEDVFETTQNRKVYDIGIAVGKALATDCPAYFDLFYDEQEETKTASSNFFNKAEELYSQGAYKEAIENYNQAIRIDPENAGYYNSRGVSFFVQEEYYQAISDFMSAIKINPDIALAYYNIASLK
jgi:tetratricopeptide (TPR) repeat protein